MKKQLISLVLASYSIVAHSETIGNGKICDSVTSCVKGDIIVFELGRLSKQMAVTRVAQYCDFNKTIYTHQPKPSEIHVACVYTGEKRTTRN